MTYFPTRGAFISAPAFMNLTEGLAAGYGFAWSRTKEKEIAQGGNFALSAPFLSAQLLHLATAITTLAKPHFSKSLYISLCSFSYTAVLISFPVGIGMGLVKMVGYAEVKKMWEAHPLAKKIPFPSENKALVDFTTEKLGKVVQAAVAVSVCALLFFGKPIHAGGFLAGFALEKISHHQSLPQGLRVSLERWLPALASIASVLTADILNRALGGIHLITIAVPKGFNAFQAKMDQVLRKIFPLQGYSLADLEGPNTPTRDLSFETLKSGLEGKLRLELDPSHCSKWTIPKELEQSRNFDAIFERFVYFAWEGLSDVIRARLIDDELFHIHLKDKFSLDPVSILRALAEYRQLEKKIERGMAICACFKERGTFPFYTGTIPSPNRVKSLVLSRSTNDAFNAFVQEHYFVEGGRKITEAVLDDLRTYEAAIKAANLQGSYTFEDAWANEGALFGILKKPEFLNFVKGSFKEIEKIWSLTSFEEVKYPFSKQIEALAKEEKLTEEQFLVRWTRKQLKAFVDHLMGRKVPEGSALDVQDAIFRMAFVVPHLEKLHAAQQNVELQDLLLKMAFDAGNKCARAMKGTGSDLLTHVVSAHIERRVNDRGDSFLDPLDLKLKLAAESERRGIIEGVFKQITGIRNDSSRAVTTVKLDHHNLDSYKALNVGFCPLSPLERESVGMNQYLLWLYFGELRLDMYKNYHGALVEVARQHLADGTIGIYLSKAIGGNPNLSQMQKNELIELMMSTELEPPEELKVGDYLFQALYRSRLSDDERREIVRNIHSWMHLSPSEFRKKLEPVISLSRKEKDTLRLLVDEWKQCAYAKLVLLMNGMLKVKAPL